MQNAVCCVEINKCRVAVFELQLHHRTFATLVAMLGVSQRTHGATFWALKVTSQVATPGAESAVYDLTAWLLSETHCCEQKDV